MSGKWETAEDRERSRQTGLTFGCMYLVIPALCVVALLAVVWAVFVSVR